MTKQKPKQEGKKFERKISPKKIKMREELVELFKTNSTFLIASIKGIPSSQLQKIRHKLKKIAGIMIIKKHVMSQAIEEAAKIKSSAVLNDVKKYLEECTAVIFSQLDPFEVASLLGDWRIAARAKARQVSLQDIRIEVGPTDIPAGPMISDLSNAGVKIAIEGGKIAIKESKTLVKKGEVISENAANILAKLEVTPFEVGLEPIAAFDAKNNKIYIGIRVNKKEAVENLKKAASDARALAISTSFPVKEIIGIILAKASMEASAVNALIKNDGAKEAETKNDVEQQKQPDNANQNEIKETQGG